MSPSPSEHERQASAREQSRAQHQGRGSVQQINIRVDHYFHFARDADREQFQETVLGFIQRSETFMAKLDDDLDAILAKVTDEDTKLDSLVALVEQLKAKVDEIVSGSVTPEQQAKLDAIFAAVGDNPDRIQAAIDANTPPAPQP